MKDRNKRNLTIGTLCCLLVFMGVGFAVMNATLNIEGTATAINTWDERMTNIEGIEKSEWATNKEESKMDQIQVEQDPEGNKMYTITLYFHKNDYTLENVHTQLNNIVPNFAGTKVTEEQIKELQEIYKKGKIESVKKLY